jgi:hypothetical protein
MSKPSKVPKMSAQAAGNKRRNRSRTRLLRQRAKLVRMGRMNP